MAPSVLVKSFEDLPDPRVERTRLHRLGDVLVIAVLAVLAGADGWDDIVEWATARQKWLRTFLSLRGGIPSADTVRRIFEAINSKKFAESFHRIVAHLAKEMPDQLIAIDGKTMRRTFSRGAGQGPLHVVSAWAVEQSVVLGQVATDAKSNEITVIPEVLDTIDVKGATVTIDAMGCQRNIAAKIVNEGGDYVLALKGNHPLLHQEVVEYFEHAQQDRTIDACPPEMHETVDKGHGRIEVRRTFCTADLDWMTERTRWTGLTAIVMVERERTIGGETRCEKAYYLTSRLPDAERLGEIIRRHWSIENELHWVLDMTFDEDHSRVRDRNSTMNLALLRKLALSLLKREQSDPRKSIAMKRRRAGWDNDYLFTVLAAAAPDAR
jgi:predicted transposase YbfD/YdcC